MNYYTVGNEDIPFYDKVNDPQHCFKTREGALKELKFLQKEIPDLGVTKIWYISFKKSMLRMDNLTK